MTSAPRQRRDKEATKAALLKAGAEAFAAQGFDAATLDSIAEVAGVNKAMVAYYYGDKAGLFQAILEEAVDFILARVTSDVDPLDDPAEQLAAFIRALAEMMVARSFFPAMMLRDFQSGRFQQNEALVSRLLKFSQITRRILGEGEARGVFRPTDHHMMHLTIVGTLAYYVASQRFRDDVVALPGHEGEAMPRLEGFIAHITEVLLNGIRA